MYPKFSRSFKKQWKNLLKTKKKAPFLGLFLKYGREYEIRTHDPLLPKQVPYQTGLTPDCKKKELQSGSVENGALEETRTLDPLIRSQIL